MATLVVLWKIPNVLQLKPGRTGIGQTLNPDVLRHACCASLSCTVGLPISRTVLPADAQAAMQYLFRGVLPLTVPPLPAVEIRDGSSRSVSDLLAKEVCVGTLQTAGVAKGRSFPCA